MGSPSVCGTCGKAIRNVYDVVERRIEWRDKRKQSRRATVLTMHQCVTCANAEVEALRPTRLGGAQQGFEL